MTKKPVYILAILATMLLFGMQTRAVGAAVCYQTTSSTNQSPVRQPASWCSNNFLKESGYDVTGLPSSFPQGDDTCYFFPDSGAPSEVNCENPKYKNAPDLSADIINENTPAEPDLDTAAGNVESDGSAESGSPELDKWLNDVVNLLSAVVGIAIVGSIIIAGIQYTTAGSNASQISAAKNRITMAVLSLILFLFAFTLLQWLIPGGISILN